MSITVKLSGYKVEEFQIETAEALNEPDGEPMTKKLTLVPLD